MPLEIPYDNGNYSPLGLVTDHMLNQIGIFWVKEKGNFVATKFTKIDANAAAAAFTSPSTSSVVDPELVDAFKGLKVGEAISLEKGQVASERSFKVRVNKAAKAANRTLEWGEIGSNYIVRIAEILTPSANGTAAESSTSNARK